MRKIGTVPHGENGVLDLPPEAPAYWRRARSQYHEPERPREYPVAAALGGHMVESLGFVHRRLLSEPPIPVLPLVVNTYYPPDQPRPGRCWELGRAVRAAVEAFPSDGRVAILASGGLSHFTVDEAGRATDWQEYVPLYRSPAGTGCGMAFAAWR